ncbi:MAG: Holliday junction resolvase RuvX, partial [Clostridia bacterium]|nr:Holliday junction resolvase RuvX [Clostridia bacterium]
MVILAVDYGDVRTGLAICDPMQMLASPVGTITQKDPDLLIDAIQQVVKERKVQRIVVGEPINMDGSRGFRAQQCAEFAKRLEQATSLPCDLFDERCTTMLAHQTLNLTNTRG